MPITYCRDDLVSSRWTGVNRLLTEFEVDYNFYQHETRIGALEASITTTVSISSITSDGSALTIHLSNSSAQGPFDMPVAAFRDRGNWTADTPYLVNDTFTANGTLYRVTFAHTSAATFDPNANDGAGHDFYAAMMTQSGNALPAGGAPNMMLRKSTSSDYAVSWAFPLPNGGTTHQVLMKASNTDQDADWDTIGAAFVSFTPSTGSTLTATNVADALEELDVLITSGSGVDALHVTFTPSTGSWLTATNVDDALDELANIDAVHVHFTPSTGSSLTATDVDGAIDQLESMIGGASGTLAGLSDVSITSPADGDDLHFHSATSKWLNGHYLVRLAGDAMTGALTLSGDPTNALHAATKQYVDNAIQGLSPKAAVLCATTANITLSGEQTIDGITTSTSRVLVKDQSTASQNGIYVTASGSWTRALDMDAWSEVPAAYVFVEEGTANADTGWVCTSDPGGTLGSTSVSWVKFTGGSATSLSSLSDVNVSEGAGIDGYSLYWNNSAGKWQAKAVLAAANNLSDLANAGTARTNLGLGTAATHAAGDFLQASNDLSDLGNAATARGNLGVATGSIEVVIDGGGSVITTGLKGNLSVPFGGTITEAVLLGDRSGSIVVNVWKCTYAQFDAGSTHPVAGDKITASAPPTISSATKSQDSTLTGWTTAFSADDIFAFNVDSVSTIERVTLRLKYTK